MYKVGGDWLGQHSVSTASAAIWAMSKMRRANQNVVRRLCVCSSYLNYATQIAGDFFPLFIHGLLID
jgi:hypothetical protein